MHRKKHLLKVIGLVVIIFWLLITIFPVLWVALTSFKPYKLAISRSLSFPITSLTLDSYVRALRKFGFFRYLLNSVVVSVSVSLIVVVCAVPAAYAFSRFRFRGDRLLLLGILLFRMIPIISIILPLYILMHRIGLVDTWGALIAVHWAAKLPVAIWLLTGFIQQIPRELDEYARIDGCSTSGVLIHIIVPLVKPGLAASAMIAFLFTWNDLITTLVLSESERSQMLTVGLTKFVMQYEIDWTAMSAVGVLMLLPAIVFMIFSEKGLIKGLSAGAVKG